jgi:hypothetical protein
MASGMRDGRFLNDAGDRPEACHPILQGWDLGECLQSLDPIMEVWSRHSCPHLQTVLVCSLGFADANLVVQSYRDLTVIDVAGPGGKNVLTVHGFRAGRVGIRASANAEEANGGRIARRRCTCRVCSASKARVAGRFGVGYEVVVSLVLRVLLRRSIERRIFRDRTGAELLTLGRKLRVDGCPVACRCVFRRRNVRTRCR